MNIILIPTRCILPKVSIFHFMLIITSYSAIENSLMTNYVTEF